MAGLDLLKREFSLKECRFIEASAGSGKTFAMTHLFLRYLLEEGVAIDQILVVTFTRAVAAEFKQRVFQLIETLIEQFVKRESPFDYIQAILERGEEAIKEAKSRLQRALARFEEASIFTIHGFCFRALRECGLELALAPDEQAVQKAPLFLEQLVYDFLRTELSFEEVSPEQMEFLLRGGEEELHALARELLNYASKSASIEAGRGWRELLEAFQKESALLKAQFNWSEESLREDLLAQARLFEKLCDRTQKVKKATQEEIEAFARLMSGPIETIPLFPRSMHQEARLKRKNEAPLHHAGFVEQMQQRLLPLVEEAYDELAIRAQLAKGVQRMWERAREGGGPVTPDDLLKRMESRCQDPAFKEAVRSQYKAVFIDEFQDTDPQQWRLFQELFPLDSKTPLYVVGDPKQAIYRFRHADIYTYLEAKEAFPKESHTALEFNYRATRQLIAGLNELLTPIEGLIPLPRLGRAIVCPPILTPESAPSLEWPDGRKSLHLLIGQSEEELFERGIQEMRRLAHQMEWPLSSFAVLVKDRYQGERFLEACAHRGVPAVARRSTPLVQTEAYGALEDLLEALLNPTQAGLRTRVLSGPLFHKSEEELFSPESHFFLIQLERMARQEGLYALIREIAKNPISSLLECHLLQIAEWLGQEAFSLEGARAKLAEFAKDPQNELLSARLPPAPDALSVLTIHASKGLEFDVVLPFGLLVPGAARRELALDQSKRLTLDPKVLLEQQQELEAEKMRQFYVAVTRAKKRLYLPLIQPAPPRSPLQLFLKNVEWESWLAQRKEISYSESEEPFFLPKVEQTNHMELLASPLPLSFPSLPLTSFSQLARKESEVQRSSAPDGAPRGKEVGQLLHRLFEELPFEEVFAQRSPEELLPWVTPSLRATALEGWETECVKWLYNALHTPLPHLGRSLAACDPGKMRKEMEFLMPHAEGGMLKGFIDLFFEWEGVCYLLDWKSNAIEVGEVEETMRAQDYLLQARLYRRAMERYVALFPGLRFGGVFFLFVRLLPEGIVYV